MDESQAMRRALDLAVRGWGRVAPNPMVGAVLLRDGEIIGEGHHAEFGGAQLENKISILNFMQMYQVPQSCPNHVPKKSSHTDYVPFVPTIYESFKNIKLYHI